jgi:hypothetical protein
VPRCASLFGISPLSLVIFIGIPVAIPVWTGLVYRNNPVPALEETRG